MTNSFILAIVILIAAAFLVAVLLLVGFKISFVRRQGTRKWKKERLQTENQRPESEEIDHQTQKALQSGIAVEPHLYREPEDNYTGKVLVNDRNKSGVSVEDSGNAAEVLTTDVQDPTRRISAAKTIYHLKDTDIEELLAREAREREAVRQLLQECLDGDDFPLKQGDPQADFSIEDYVPKGRNGLSAISDRQTDITMLNH